MESLSGLLGGFGLLGLLAAGFLAFVTMLILPFWAILECALSRRSGGAKAVALIFLVLTWGFGSIVYGLFVTTSKLLRIVTVIAMGGVLIVLVPSVISVLAGAGIHSSVLADQSRREVQAIQAQFHPATIPVRDLAPYHALHFTYNGFDPSTAAVARFSAGGPEAVSARDTDRGIRHVAFAADQDLYWAVTAQEFGSIDPASGRFSKIDIDSSIGDFSWPRGVAYDAADHAVYVLTSHVFTQFYRFDPATSGWQRLPSEIRDLPLAGLALGGPDRCLYAAECRTGEHALRRLHRFNLSGASLGPIDLHPAVPIPERGDALVQLQSSGNRLVLIVPPFSVDGPRAASLDGNAAVGTTYVIDPKSGEVLVPDAASI